MKHISSKSYFKKSIQLTSYKKIWIILQYFLRTSRFYEMTSTRILMGKVAFNSWFKAHIRREIGLCNGTDARKVDVKIRVAARRYKWESETTEKPMLFGILFTSLHRSQLSKIDLKSNIFSVRRSDTIVKYSSRVTVAHYIYFV